MHQRLPAIVMLLCATLVAAQTVQPILQPHQHYVDAAGAPCAGCKLFSYVAGTTKPLATYADSTGTVQNTNPVTLDVAGGANIWLVNNTYKLVLQDARGNLLWTVDNVPGFSAGGGSGGGSPAFPPGGATGEVQINNGGVFGSIPGFTYSSSGNFLDGTAAGLSISAAFIGASTIGTGVNGGYLESLPYVVGNGLDPNYKHLMACVLNDGTAHICPTTSSYWSGLTHGYACPAAGCSVSVAIAGTSSCVFDNTALLGDFVILSTIVAGQCHSVGATYPTSGTLVGQVSGAGTPPEAPVYLMRAGLGGGTSYTLPSQYKTWSCQPGLGDGLNAIPAGTYLQSECWNTTGVTVTLTGVKCYTDVGSSTLNASGNTLGALLTGAVTCTSSLASGTQSANVLLTNNDFVKFTFVADGTSKQTTFVVTGTY